MTTFDAAPRYGVPIIPKNLIDEEVLRGIELDLDPCERISCMFFIIDDYSSGYESLMNALDNDRSELFQFIKDNRVSDWEAKLIETLCLVQNNEILLKLGVNPKDACTIFVPSTRENTYKINKYAKVFYSLFEELSKEDAQELLCRVYQDLPRPDCKTWPKNVSLELHLLWWIKRGLISISQERWSLTKLLLILKELGLSTNGVYQTLKNYDDQININSPCHYDDQTMNIGSMSSPRNENNVANDCGIEATYVINNGLVVIFNQMEFTGPTDYPYRKGSEVDSRYIVKTFREKFRFETKVHINLKRDSIYSELDGLHSDGNKYDCVVVVILSHGTKGNVIASDGLECPIETIKFKLCSDFMQDKPKILVIQACQTQNLTTDSPRTEGMDVARFEDLLILNSTIPGEKSIRDEERGTWFIQTLCDVLIEKKGNTVEECCTRVREIFKGKKARVDGRNMKQVPECTTTLAKRLIFPYKAT